MCLKRDNLARFENIWLRSSVFTLLLLPASHEWTFYRLHLDLLAALSSDVQFHSPPLDDSYPVFNLVLFLFSFFWPSDTLNGFGKHGSGPLMCIQSISQLLDIQLHGLDMARLR